MGIASKYGGFYNPATNKSMVIPGQKFDKKTGTIKGMNGAEMTPRKFGELSRPRYRRGKVRRRY